MSTHPRVERTRRAFEDAAIAAADADPDGVTVRSLCEDAGLNRGTFYLHYRDLDDLLASTVERLAQAAVDQWKSSIEMDRGTTLSERSKAALGAYLEHIYARRSFYRWALVARGSFRAVSVTTAVYVDGISVGLSGSDERWKNASELRRRSAYLAGAMAGVIIQWLAEDEPESPGELREWLWKELTDPSDASAANG